MSFRPNYVHPVVIDIKFLTIASAILPTATDRRSLKKNTDKENVRKINRSGQRRLVSQIGL